MDNWSENKCKKMKKKCKKDDNVAENCKKTCEMCEDEGEGCGIPEYAEDEYCDDSNNNKGCNYDGGACCPGDDPMEGQDKFCDACECLDPNAGGDSNCLDKWPEKKCKKMAKKCKKKKVKQNCMKTCDACGEDGCMDNWSDKKCKKMKKKCKKGKVKKNCMKTCGVC